MSDFSTPPGWYPDGDGYERRWDGTGWTDERRQSLPAPPAADAETALPGQGETTFPSEATMVRPSGPPPASAPPAPQQYGGPHGAPPPLAAPPVGAGPLGAPSNPAFAPQGQPYGQQYGQPGGFGGQPPAFGQPVGYGGFTPAPKKSRAGLLIAIAAVLVLVLGVGITLAAVQPWKSDDDSSTADDGNGGGGDNGGDGGGGAEGRAIQGDLNGDGKGDARYRFQADYDNVKEITAISNGEVFETTELAVEPYDAPHDVWFDWDGDGVNEKLTWKFIGSGKQLTLSSGESGWPGDQNFQLTLSTLKTYGDPEVQLATGDFDGDGDQDIVVAGPNDKQVDFAVLANDGKGTFSDPAVWLSLTNAVIDAVEFLPGDFDGDGKADLWAGLPSEKLTDKDYGGYYSGDKGKALLTSTGSSFTAGAVNKTSTYADAWLVGDVVGDGSTNVISVESSGYKEEVTVAVWDVSSGKLDEVDDLGGTTEVGKRYLQGASLSDVDGDGDGDIVFAVKAFEEKKFTGIQVMSSDKGTFGAATVWAETPTCDDDNCRIEFPGKRW